MPSEKVFKSHGMNWSNQELRGQDFTRIAANQADEDGRKVPGFRFDGSGKSFQTASVEHSGQKTTGHINKRNGHSHTRHLTNQAEHDGVKQGGDWFAEARSGGVGGTSASLGSKSKARKAASAVIAKIPLTLARHIAWAWKPRDHPPALT